MAEFIDGVAERSWPNPWGAVTGRRYQVWCSDGKVRVATATAEPDTFFTMLERRDVRETVELDRAALLNLLSGTYRGARFTLWERVDAMQGMSVTLSSEMCVLRKR